jgi:hypothetical protein
MATASAWEELHSLLAEEPSELTFRAVVGLLDTWPGGNREAIAAASRALDAWPDELRLAPWSWCCSMAAGEQKPTWSLVRAVRLDAGHIGSPSFAVEQLNQDILGPVLTHVILDRYSTLDDHDDAAWLAAEAERWPRLRCVRGLAGWDDGLRSFLGCDLLPQLEEIELFLPASPASADPVPGLRRAASRLEELHISFGQGKDIRPLLDARFLPALRGLSLEGQWFMGDEPDHFRRLADLPLLDQVHLLLLSEFPCEVVAGILARPGLCLERLELRNRHNMPNLVDYQLNACRLNADSVQLIAQSADLSALHHLTIQHERIGDAVLHLVEAATPGRLETLELIDVALTDQDLAHLAAMPQLRGVTVLNLQENHFTDTGLAALLRSPHLGALRRLFLGGRPHWSPYYNENPCQSLGDSGAAALASSGVLSGLSELVLCSASVGPAGAAALAGAEAPHLRRLDLSNNPLGSRGAAALARAVFLSGLREVVLSLCQLDDEAMYHLKAGDFRSLRALRLAYNSIGPTGARHLAEAGGLGGLRLLELHDNFIGDEGLIALAGSDHLGGLLELDLEQDVWNYRGAPFGDEAARAVASSAAFSRLDGLFAGEVDEYTGGFCRAPFSRQGREVIRASTMLRPEARRALLAPEWDEPEPGEVTPSTDNPNQFFLHYTPREVERGRREADFRDLPPPELSMDERQWLEATDPAWMLEFLGERAGERKRRLFACACARRALRLQPDDRLETCLAVAEQLADGKAGEDDRARALQTVREIRYGGPEDQLRTNVSCAVYYTLSDSAQDAAADASGQAIRAAIEDMRRRQPGSVARVSYTPEHAAQAALLRCLFGNPHRRPQVDPAVLAWNSATVSKMAHAIDETRAFEQLPILADALEEAGCTDREILDHCRGGGEHVHGCWVLDHLLGRTV